MYEILSKYNFITIIPFDETFFYASTLPKKVKFTKELVHLNYSKYSPYKNSNIINYIDSDYLMLWFYEKEISSTIIIPESYLVFKELKSNQKDSIYIIQDDNIKIIIIKNNKLINAFSLDTIDEVTIKLTMDEYQIFQKDEITQNEYKDILQKAKKSLNIKDFYKFNNLELDRKTLLNNFVEKVSYPIAILIIFTIFISYLHENMLKSDIKNLKATYSLEKDKNRDIKSYIKKHNKEVKKWRGFALKELVYVEPVSILNSIYSIFEEKEKAYLVDVSISENKVLIKIQTDINPIVFLNRLNEINCFSRVIIQNTHKPRDAMKIISYDIEVKMLKDI